MTTEISLSELLALPRKQRTIPADASSTTTNDASSIASGSLSARTAGRLTSDLPSSRRRRQLGSVLLPNKLQKRTQAQKRRQLARQKRLLIAAHRQQQQQRRKRKSAAGRVAKLELAKRQSQHRSRKGKPKLSTISSDEEAEKEQHPDEAEADGARGSDIEGVLAAMVQAARMATASTEPVASEGSLVTVGDHILPGSLRAVSVGQLSQLSVSHSGNELSKIGVSVDPSSVLSDSASSICHRLAVSGHDPELRGLASCRRCLDLVTSQCGHCDDCQ
ncbi:unnamed protein product [Protopolystoma xenopodis]|uniref:Uncharacterized protein n=1 Tax=Protopolystoma xenopodis TaxID=117903 RepID=A0A448WNN1_9PLAT|nr:unnamed protein product [Protopolystoma xenopodis]